MATENPVNQVLVVSANVAALAAGSRVDALAVGQVGIFNFHTGLSIDGSVPVDAKDIFIAVGLNKTGAGGGATLEDINKSAGQVIQVRNAKSLTLKGYVIGLPKIDDITGFSAKCETDYLIKVEFRSSAVYGLHGTNQFTKTWGYRTSCCADQCEPCGAGDNAELASNLINQINADPDQLVTASAIAFKITGTVGAGAGATASITVLVGSTSYTVPVTSGWTATQVAAAIVAVINTAANSPYKASNASAVMSIYPIANQNASTETIALSNANGTGVTITPVVAATKTVIADTAAFIAAYPGASLSIRLTTNAEAVRSYCSINLKYHKLRMPTTIISLIEGFACNGTVTNIQALRYQEGSGYDLKQEEYEAGGYNGKPGPYRQSEVTGLAVEGFESYVDAAATYTQIVLTYDQMSVGGWLEYLNNLETKIVFPCANTTAINSFVGIMDLIFTQFGAMTNDAAAVGCDSVAISALVSATDGIESLA